VSHSAILAGLLLDSVESLRKIGDQIVFVLDAMERRTSQGNSNL